MSNTLTKGTRSRRRPGIDLHVIAARGGVGNGPDALLADVKVLRIAGKKAAEGSDGGMRREADPTEKQQLKKQLEQHYGRRMDTGQDGVDAQRHADEDETK